MQQQADPRRDDTETAFSFLAARLPARDLTMLAREGKIRPSVQPGGAFPFCGL